MVTCFQQVTIPLVHMKILATDVHYYDYTRSAVAAGIILDSWDATTQTSTHITQVSDVEDYVPGKFYLRELPCLLALLREHALTPDIVIVDGYVHLGDGSPGLGAYLYEALNRDVMVVGVAKTSFHGIPGEWSVIRGGSTRPVFVTAAGMPLEDAKQAVTSMYGKHRMPALLTAVDHACRGMQ